MFRHTDIPEAPWHGVAADEKERARLNCIAHLLDQIPYQAVRKGRIRLPKLEVSKRRVRRPAIDEQRWVPDVYEALMKTG
jgi:hypothetical protein